jgi:hypothetical protein
MADTQRLNDALAANYMLVDLQLRSWSGRKTDKTASDEVIANKGAVRDSGKFVKNLFASADAELKAVQQQGNMIRGFVYSQTLPWSANSDGAKRGERLISATRAMEFLVQLNEIKRDYDKAVSELQRVWDTRIQQAVANLSELADNLDYPSSTEIPSLFSVSVDVRPVPVMADFSRVSVPPALAEALGQRHMQMAEEQARNAMADLKKRLLDELNRMAKQLGKAGKGEKTRLYDSLVTNMQGLVELTRTMNVTGNPELTALADEIEKKLLQSPVEVYRNSPEQAAAAATMASVLAVEAAEEAIWQ